MFFGRKKKGAVPEENTWIPVQENSKQLSTDYADRCGNCHEFLRPEDKFCRYCGTRRGEGAFEPYRNVMECIYGPPPVERRHTCENCGYSWTTMAMIDEQRYCPKCGGNAGYRENDQNNSDISVKKEQKKLRDPEEWVPIHSEQKVIHIDIVSEGTEFSFPARPFIIGRDSKADLHIANPRVSRMHARLYRQNHQWYLEEYRAVNGTFLNGRKLNKGESCAVYEGDEIRLADEKLIITDIKGTTIVR